MGASFRSTAQIEALAGCDRLTISPDLLEKLDAEHGELPRKLSPAKADNAQFTPIDSDSFASGLAADPMATEKLAGGIDTFARTCTHCARPSPTSSLANHTASLFCIQRLQLPGCGRCRF